MKIKKSFIMDMDVPVVKNIAVLEETRKITYFMIM